MKIKNQVCSLELSKQLKKLGVKQESVWYWYNHSEGNKLTMNKNTAFKVSAFTVAELGEMLEYSLDITGVFPQPIQHGLWRLELDDITIESETEANARAKMLIYLLENKLLKN